MIIAIPNASDDVTIPTAIPIPSPVIQQANNITYSLQHVMALYMWSQPNDTCGYSNDIQYVLPSKNEFESFTSSPETQHKSAREINT